MDNKLSIQLCFLLYRPSTETPSGTISPLSTPVPGPPKPLTSRQQVAMELLQTERNYVEILTNILKVSEWLRLAKRVNLSKNVIGLGFCVLSSAGSDFEARGLRKGVTQLY